MKKYFTIKFLGVLLIAAAVSSCQKDQGDTTLMQTSGTQEEGRVSGQAITANNISGLISEESGENLRENYHNKNARSGNETEYVAFSVKDLSNYLALIRSKYKSDSVYVSFGVYDEKTAVNKKNIGRTTIFFMGKNNVSKAGRIRSQDDTGEDNGDGSNYLNHGNIYP
jgi:thioredoxin reductase